MPSKYSTEIVHVSTTLEPNHSWQTRELADHKQAQALNFSITSQRKFDKLMIKILGKCSRRGRVTWCNIDNGASKTL